MSIIINFDFPKIKVERARATKSWLRVLSFSQKNSNNQQKPCYKFKVSFMF